MEYEQLILQAIEVRTRLMGRSNILNAISFSKLSMFARLLGDRKDALQYHSKAMELFSKFSANHPNSWIMYLSSAALLLRDKNQFAVRQELMQCLEVADRRYSSDHVGLMKIKLSAGKMLLEVGLHQQGIELYEAVDANLGHLLAASVLT